MNSGSAAEGSFGRRTSCMVAWLPQLAPECFCMFGSVWGIRPPKVPPKVRDFRLWSALWPPKLAPERVRPPNIEIRPPKVLEFRLWRGHSAAEPAAESVLSSFSFACFAWLVK